MKPDRGRDNKLRAAAAVINDGPVRTETERLLGLDTAAVKSIMNAADDPTAARRDVS